MSGAKVYGNTDKKFPMWALHACLAHWYGDKGVAVLNYTKIGRIACDGGSYNLVGIKISSPGDGAGVIYHQTTDFMDRPCDEWVIEFYDGSGGKLILDESANSVMFDNYYDKRTFYTPQPWTEDDSDYGDF